MPLPVGALPSSSGGRVRGTGPPAWEKQVGVGGHLMFIHVPFTQSFCACHGPWALVASSPSLTFSAPPGSWVPTRRLLASTRLQVVTEHLCTVFQFTKPSPQPSCL